MASSPADAVEAAIDYAACLVRCKGPKPLLREVIRAFVRGNDVFVLLRVASHRIRQI